MAMNRIILTVIAAKNKLDTITTAAASAVRTCLTDIAVVCS